MEISFGFHYVLMFKDKLYLLIYLQVNSLKETYEKIFNFIMKILNEKYNFCINAYKALRHNLMRNDGLMKNDHIVHRDFKIV